MSQPVPQTENATDEHVSFKATEAQAAYIDELAEQHFRATPGMTKPNRSAALRWLMDHARKQRLLLPQPSRKAS